MRRGRSTGVDPAFLGSRITINSDDYTIIGVAPEGFSGTLAMLSPEVFLPLGMFDAVVDNRYKNNGRGLGDRSNVGLSVAGRLAPGVTMEGAAARLDVLSRQLAAAYPSDHRNLELTTGLLSRLSLSTGPQNNTALATFTGFLLTLSGMVLVIACLNIANMLLARGAAAPQGNRRSAGARREPLARHSAAADRKPAARRVRRSARARLQLLGDAHFPELARHDIAVHALTGSQRRTWPCSRQPWCSRPLAPSRSGWDRRSVSRAEIWSPT